MDINNLTQEMIQWRHYLHKNPELSLVETNTANFIKKHLIDFGFDEIIENFAGTTALLGILRQGEGDTIAHRADMDALPIQEKNTFSYASQNPGVMHACGHDGHVAMLLGAAKYLADHKKFKGTIVFIFQPGEEYGNGAEIIVEQGKLFEQFDIKSIHAIHNFPTIKTGSFIINSGPMMAAADDFVITVNGQKGHAAFPHLAKDPIITSVSIINNLQTIVSRNIDPHDPLVITVASIKSDTETNNIIAEKVIMEGTVRYYNPAFSSYVKNRLIEIVTNTATAFGLNADVEYHQSCPPTNNSIELLPVINKVVKMIVDDQDITHMPPVMGSEDFSFYLKYKQGFFIGLGNGVESKSLHDNCYDFNDNNLPLGAEYFIKVAYELLN